MIKPIPDFPGYYAEDNGTIYSLHKSGLKKKATAVDLGRNRVDLYRNNRGYKISVGSLVLKAFAGPKPTNMEACHGPKGRLIDSLDNLYWGTHQQNMIDRVRDGTHNRGERQGSHKLTNTQIRVIRHSADLRVSQGFLAKIFGIGRDEINRIVNFKRWAHISHTSVIR